VKVQHAGVVFGAPKHATERLAIELDAKLAALAAPDTDHGG